MSTLDVLLALGSKRKVHEFDALGTTLRYRGLSHAEKAEWIKRKSSGENTALDLDNSIIAMALCAADGTRLYSDDAGFEEACNAIANWDTVEVVKPLIDLISAASGIGKAAEDATAKK